MIFGRIKSCRSVTSSTAEMWFFPLSKAYWPAKRTRSRVLNDFEIAETTHWPLSPNNPFSPFSQVRGYSTVKRGLQRRLATIEHDRKMAHHPEESAIDMVKKVTTLAGSKDDPNPFGEFPLPNGPRINTCHKNNRTSRPMMKTTSCISYLSQPRYNKEKKSFFVGVVDFDFFEKIMQCVLENLSTCFGKFNGNV